MSNRAIFELAEKTLNENLSDEELENALNGLTTQRTYKEINAGNFNEALNLINQLPENLRINLLIFTANSLYGKDPQNNKSLAVSVLEQAHSLINNKPENSNEMSSLTQIIAAYSSNRAGRSISAVRSAGFSDQRTLRSRCFSQRFYRKQSNPARWNHTFQQQSVRHLSRRNGHAAPHSDKNWFRPHTATHRTIPTPRNPYQLKTNVGWITKLIMSEKYPFKPHLQKNTLLW